MTPPLTTSCRPGAINGPTVITIHRRAGATWTTKASPAKSSSTAARTISRSLFRARCSDRPPIPNCTPAGIHLYNRWLADFVSRRPSPCRACLVPYWDIEAATAEVELGRGGRPRWRELPPCAMRDGVTPYDLPRLGPFWAACADSLRMPLLAHRAGAGETAGSGKAVTRGGHDGAGEGRVAQPSGHIHFMIFSGVFERYPDLTSCYRAARRVAVPGAGARHGASGAGIDGPLARQVPRRPSEYLHRNVFIGPCSSRATKRAAPCATATRIALCGGRTARMDLHLAGWRDLVQPTFPAVQPVRAQRAPMCGFMVGDPAEKVYGLDLGALRRIPPQTSVRR